MTQDDAIVLLVTGIVGTFWDQRIAWGIIGVWGLLKLVKVF